MESNNSPGSNQGAVHQEVSFDFAICVVTVDKEEIEAVFAEQLLGSGKCLWFMGVCLK